MAAPSPESVPPTGPADDRVDGPGSSALFAKLLVLVVALIGTGAGLLAIRHQRLETMHRIAETREAIDLELARQRTLEARIAALLHPDLVRERLRVADIGPWVPRPEPGRGETDARPGATLADRPGPPVDPPPPAPPRFGPRWAVERSAAADDRP